MAPNDPRFLVDTRFAEDADIGPSRNGTDDELSEEEVGDDASEGERSQDGLEEGMNPDGFAGPSEKVVKPLTPEALAAFKAAQERAGVLYISRIPPGMRPTKVRHIMSAYGEVGRVYLQQEDAKRAYLRRKYTATKKAHFTEGWVEFKDKRVARSVAEMLNAQPIGGKKGTRWRDDVWTMKYLPKFKWNMLTEQIGTQIMSSDCLHTYDHAAHEAAAHAAQLRVELSQSRQEQREYLRNVELARVLDKRAERKRKAGADPDTTTAISAPQPSQKSEGRPERPPQTKPRKKQKQLPEDGVDTRSRQLDSDPYRADWEAYDRERAWATYERERAAYEYSRRGRSRSPGPDEAGRKRRRSLSPWERDRDRFEPRPRYGDDYDAHTRGYGGYSPHRGQYPPPPPYGSLRRAPPDPHTLDYSASLKQYAEWFRYYYPQQATEEDNADKAAEQEAGDGSKPRNGIRSRWEKYKKEFAAQQLQRMFEHHRKSPWFAEKYDPSPEFVALRQRVRRIGWRGRMDSFLLDLEAGKYDPDLNEPEAEAASPVKESASNGDTTAAAADAGTAQAPAEEAKPTVNASNAEDDMQFNVEQEDDTGEQDANRQDAGKTSADNRRNVRGEEYAVLPEGNQVMIRTIPPDIGRVKLEEACDKIPGFVYLALGDPLQKRNYYRAGWLKFRDDADMPTAMAELAEKKIEGFKLHVAHNTKPFTGRIRYAPEVASKPDRISKDLANVKILAAILEEEYETLRRLKIQSRKDNGNEATNGDSSNTDVAMADATGAAEEDPEPKERGSEAVEKRIEKVMANLRDQGLVDPADEKAMEQKKAVVALDLYLAYLRAAFHTCYYCAVVSDHVEELQRKCVKHVRKPMSKTLLEEVKAAEAAQAQKVEEEQKVKGEGEEKPKDASGKEKSENRDWKRNDERWLEWLDSKVALLINRDGVDPRDYAGKNYEEELSKAAEPHIKQEDEGKFRCKTCQKLFKATSFVEKHIANKHPELVKYLEEIPYFNNFALDPHRIQPFAHPPPPVGNSQAPPPQAYGLQGPAYPVAADYGRAPHPAPYGYPPPYSNAGLWDPYAYPYGPNGYPPPPPRRDDGVTARRLSDRISGYAPGYDPAVEVPPVPASAGLPAKPVATLEPGPGGRRGGRNGSVSGPPTAATARRQGGPPERAQDGSSSEGETDISEEELSRPTKRSAKAGDGEESEFVTPTNHLDSDQNPMDQAAQSSPPPRLSRAFSMPLPSQLGSLRNPRRVASSPDNDDTTTIIQLPPEYAHFHELSLELADSVQMVIQTLLQLSPPQVLDPAKEQFSACSLSIPTPSVSAMFTSMKNLNYMSANMSALSLDPPIQQATTAGERLGMPTLFNDFDIGEMLQSAGDALSGVAAQAGVDLVLFHGDLGMKHVGPSLRSLFLRRLLSHVGATLELDVQPKGALPAGRFCELAVNLDRGSPAVVDPTVSGAAEEALPGSPELKISHEPTLEQLTQFAESLRGRKATLFANSKGSFAQHLTSYLTAWGMDVSHVSAEPDADTLPEHMEGSPQSASSTSTGRDDSPSSADAEQPTGLAPPPSGIPGPEPLSFYLIDDDVSVLRERLQKIRAEQAYPLHLNTRKRPSLANHHRPRSSPQVARVMGLTPATTAPNSPSPVIVHFTSLSNFKLVKDAIQSVFAPGIGAASRLPEVIVIPKPAGPRRVLTALHTAITKPIVDPFFYPTATSPISPGFHAMTPFFNMPNAARSPGARSTTSIRTTSDKSARSPKDHTPSSPRGVSDTMEYFSDAAAKLGTSPASGLVIQSPDGQPAGIFFHPKPKGSGSRSNLPTPVSERGAPSYESMGRTRAVSFRRPPDDSKAGGLTAGTSDVSRRGSRPPMPESTDSDGREGQEIPSMGRRKSVPASEGLPPLSTESPISAGIVVGSPVGEPSPATSSSLRNVPRKGSQVDPLHLHLPDPPSPSASVRRPRRNLDSPASALATVQKKGKPSDTNIVPPISVLIVDDNPINQTILSTFMKKKKIKFDVAKNGEEAVAKWQTGGFHLVLMDIQMPVMDGIEATKQIRRMEKFNATGAFPSTPQSEGQRTPSEASLSESRSSTMSTPPYRSSVIIVALTASSLQSDRVAALAAGCNDFLTKPVSLHWLNSKIIEWGSIKALQMWADIRPEVVKSISSGQAAQAQKVARRLHVPEGRTPTDSRSRSSSVSRNRQGSAEGAAAAARKLAADDRTPTQNTPMPATHDDSPGSTSGSSSDSVNMPHAPLAAEIADPLAEPEIAAGSAFLGELEDTATSSVQNLQGEDPSREAVPGAFRASGPTESLQNEPPVLAADTQHPVTPARDDNDAKEGQEDALPEAGDPPVTGRDGEPPEPPPEPQ
ncbi:hypothetical protein EVJ58_g373 [Rhodofomes roseus]|uniref:18S rRNA factor 2 n=1 Tax=Rhodofomes roseus TaxID=34475 RepID=A0A4Y9Z6R2_9APHY|nr:hypothetical protein EVJ58_g373 [Rhodofomes roseus]